MNRFTAPDEPDELSEKTMFEVPTIKTPIRARALPKI